MLKKSEKRYLGDAVYADVEHGMIVLTTENGISATNTIYLEPAVVTRLEEFIKEVKESEDEVTYKSQE